MPNWKKIIVSGSDATLSSLTVTNEVTASSYTGSFTGSLVADAGISASEIYIENSVYSSGSITASFFKGDGRDLTNVPAFPFTGSAGVFGSLTLTSAGNDYVDSDGGEQYVEDYIFGGEALNVVDNVTIGGSLTAPSITGSLSGSFEGSLFLDNLNINSQNQYVNDDYVNNEYVGGISLITTGSAIINGGLDLAGPMYHTNGVTVLTEVSESLNFTNDTEASIGGVPLGGLYRNGNIIQIRIT